MMDLNGRMETSSRSGDTALNVVGKKMDLVHFSHSSTRLVLKNRPKTVRYSRSTGLDTANWNRPSRQRSMISPQRPCHRLDTNTLVSKTTLGFGTLGAYVGNQAINVFGADVCARGGAARAGAQVIQTRGKRGHRQSEPLDQAPQRAPLFNLFQTDLRVCHILPPISGSASLADAREIVNEPQVARFKD